jgi:transcriptional regulator with XRE-family HTH domain
MTQKDFAKQIGRSEAEVSRWVGGTHNFTLATLAKISTVLEIPLISVTV